MARFDAVGVVVSDMSRAVAFYRTLGLDFEAGAEEGPHVEAVGPGGIRFMLDTEATVQSFSDWAPPEGGSPRVALAFLCQDPAEVGRLYGELLDAGGAPHVEPFDAPWGQRYATVHDPDANPVDLFAPLEPPEG